MSAYGRPDGTRHAPAAVRAELARWLSVPANLRAGRFPAELAIRDVNAVLNGGYDWQDKPTDRQVRRALLMLAQPGGSLRRVPRGQYSPDGARSDMTLYYTPAGWADAEEQAAARQAGAGRSRRDWERVWDALAAMGIMPLGERGRPVTLSLISWGRLTRTDISADAVVPP